MTQIAIYILLVLLSYGGVFLIRRWVVKDYLLDHPNDRSMHSMPIPRGGGLAIVLVVLGTGLLFAWQTELHHSLVYVACGIVIALLGWRDDVKSLSPIIRFAVQGIVAVVSIISMGYFKSVTIPLFGELQLGVVGVAITFLWIIGLTNAYNFMDGIDGMAGGVAVSAGLGWMWLSSASGNSFAFWVALAISAGSLGFLFHNWSPAKIFMGDVASTFLGYSFAVLSLLSADKGGDALLLGTLLMWTFIMDAGLTFINRLRKGEKVFSAHRSHLFQRLVIGGYKHSTVSSLYILLTLFAGYLSYEWARGHQFAAPIIFLGLPLIWILLSRYASRLKKMLTKFRTLASLYRQLGLRWLTFRFAYAFRIRVGLIRLQMPAYQWKDRPLGTWLKKDIPSNPKSYAEWRRQNSPDFFFKGANQFPENIPWNPQLAVDEAERILSGEIKYFAHEFQKTGFPPDWHKDPVTGIKLDSSKHWSQLSDEGEVDIKFIWEASRFSFVYTLARAYAFNRDERYAEAFWQLIESWVEANSPNTGPNWMDGQEAALRLMAWTFGLYAFMDSPSTTPQRIANITVYIAAHAQRIYSNTDFAIFTRGNHSISEALGLWMVGLLFPELKDSEKYLSFGRMSLEREAVQQIFPDGSYSMYSLNYHRFVLQMLLYAIKLAELNGVPFSESLYRVANLSVDYLYQLVDPRTGQMPVYGSNDGALVLPLNSCDFTDYRPVLQLGSSLLKGKSLFESGAWNEDLYWLCGSESLITKVDAPEQTNQSFSNGGVYVLHNAHSKAVIRCTNFQERPSHADQLHVDLWWRGENIAIDAGTYLYSGDNIWRNGLAHTSAHNTVIVDSKDQMKMVSRFTWVDWAQGKVLQHDEKKWQGEHDGYTHLPDPVTHKRTVLMFDDDRWLVVDHLNGKQPHHYALHWLFCDGEFGVQQLAAAHKVLLTYSDNKLSESRVSIQIGLLDGDARFSVVRADPQSTRGWRSKYYGQKEPAISAMLETDQPQVVFWTFFGSEEDAVELDSGMLKIKSPTLTTTVGLDTLHLNTLP